MKKIGDRIQGIGVRRQVDRRQEIGDRIKDNKHKLNLSLFCVRF
jgi:hypothetical protein